MKKTIQISNYSLGQRFCPYYEAINDYTPYKTDFDLSDPAETGLYYHDSASRYINDVPQLGLDETIEKDAYQTVKWIKNTFGSGEEYSETELHAEILGADVVGKPDYFMFNKQILTVIDYKYTDAEDDRYYTALLLYLMLIIKNFPEREIKTVNIVLKYKSKVKQSTISFDLAKKLINQEEMKLKNYINNINYVTNQKCLTCRNCESCSQCQKDCFKFAAEAGPAAGKQQMLFCQQVINRKFQKYKDNNATSSYKAFPQNKDTINKIAEIVEKKAAETGENPKITKYITKSEAQKYLTQAELDKYCETKTKSPSPVCPWD